MFGNIFSQDDNKKVDFINSPEQSGPEDSQYFSSEKAQKDYVGGGIDKNLSRKLNFLRRFDIKRPKVEGREKLPDRPSIIATTHLTDVDEVAIAAEVARDRKIGIASFATNQASEEFKFVIDKLGRDNFFDVTNSQYSEGGNTSVYLRANDIDNLAKALEDDGRTLIISGHNRLYYENAKKKWELPNEPGLAAILTKHFADIAAKKRNEKGPDLIPAALNVKSKNPVAFSEERLGKIPRGFPLIHELVAKRSEIKYGNPIEVADISEDKLREAMRLYSLDERRSMSTEEVASAQATLAILKEEGSRLMERFAKLLPPEKQGIWNKKAQDVYKLKDVREKIKEEIEDSKPTS